MARRKKRREVEREPREHPFPLGSKHLPRNEFDRLLCLVARVPRRVLRDGRHARMIAALDHRASFGMIRHWRAGRFAAPKWAIDLLIEKHAADCHDGLDAIAGAAALKPGLGRAWRRQVFDFSANSRPKP